MELTAILKKIADARKSIVISEPNLDAQNILDDLALSLQREIVQQTMNAGQRQQYKAVLAFANHCASLGRSAMAGAYMADLYGQPRQVLLDGFIAVAFKRPWDGLPQIPEGVTPIDVASIFEGAEQGTPVDLPDLYQMMGEYKAWKVSGFTDRLVTRLGVAYANTDYLIKVMKMLGITGGTCYVRSPVTAILIKSHHGEGLVLPVRFEGCDPKNCWNK